MKGQRSLQKVGCGLALGATIALAVAPWTRAAAALGEVPQLIAQPDRVELTTARQKLEFGRAPDGTYVLTTSVWDDRRWRSLFDAGRPLLEGPSFGLHPAAYTVLTNEPDRKALEFAGRHPRLGYDWSMRVEAAAGSPLFRFTIACKLPGPLSLQVPQPVVGLWMKCSNPAVHLDQGPDSIYGSAGIAHGYGFPAACLWDGGRMAGVFFDMTSARWMRPDGVCRFNDVRIMARAENGQTGLGMHFKKASGRQLHPGEMTVEFYLYQDFRPRKPTGLEALDTMIRVFAPLHPSRSVFPLNRFTGRQASWEQLAGQTLADLMAGPETFCEFEAPWRDEPLELVPGQKTMLVHPGAPMTDTNQTCHAWDFSTVNNHLTPWLLLARLHGNAALLRAGLQKKDALPRFYDPRARLLRHGTRQPPHVGDLEMTWQNLFFHEETLRATSAAGAGDFNPAVAGRFLMATAGLRELASNVDFVFPQWFDPYRKQAVVQNDVKKLGVVREPWQAGAYAHLMMRAFKITGQMEFRAEAQRAIEALLERMEFRVQNEIYDRRYTEAAEFPITELFGNAYGITAALQLHDATGHPKFLRYSRDFLNTLLRLTFWYEDETDPISRELRNAGLFYPHGGAHVPTPWETAEAHLLIASTLKHDREHPLTDLLLRLSNLNRINSFYFFPATWSETVRRLDPSRLGPLGEYFPIEPFYCLEGTGGHRGPTAAYMAGLALWNDWLYEALAEATDRDVMVLNLDAMEDYETALTGVERHFVAYNPGPTNRACRIVFKCLPEEACQMTARSREQRYSKAELERGLPFTLRAGEFIRIDLRSTNHRQQTLRWEGEQAAQSALACAYRSLQERAVTQSASIISPERIHEFARACQAYREGRFSQARAAALELVEQAKK